MNIIVSGITTMKQIRQLEGLEIAYAAFSFVKGSADFAGSSLLADELAGLDLDIKKIGIFENEEHDEILEIVEKYDLDLVILNGEEDPELCENLSEEPEVIKTFKVDKNSKELDNVISEYDDVCDYYLFEDSTTIGKFDWKFLAQNKIEKPFFIGGLIRPEDFAALKKFKHPDFFGVMINEAFNKEDGTKNMGAILKFTRDLK